jgi:hypothetical protein
MRRFGSRVRPDRRCGSGHRAHEGQLVLTKAGSDRAHDALLQGPGGNVQWVSAVISGARRFSHYKVKVQQTVHGTTSPTSSW